MAGVFYYLARRSPNPGIDCPGMGVHVCGIRFANYNHAPSATPKAESRERLNEEPNQFLRDAPAYNQGGGRDCFDLLAIRQRMRP